MSLFAITINGQVTVIEAPSKSAANAWAHAHVNVDVRLATKEDLMASDMATLPSVEKGGKTAEEKQKEETEAAARKEKSAAKKAAKEAAKAAEAAKK